MSAALSARPTDATLAARTGEMALALGERDAALAHAEEAIRLDPQLGSAWALRGRAFWQLQQPDRALADLARALEFSPESADVLLDLAVIYRDQGQPQRSLTALHHLQNSCTAAELPNSALVLEGLALLDLGRNQQACDAFLAAVEREPASAQLQYNLAHAQYAAGRYAEATAAAQRALAIDGSHHASQRLLAQLAAREPAAEPQRR
jgi:tetratricopeptide (TPR) repeat protein